MACDITHGRIEECKDSVSGLKAIYIINFDDLNEDTATFDTGTPGEEDLHRKTPFLRREWSPGPSGHEKGWITLLENAPGQLPHRNGRAERAGSDPYR